MTDITHKQYEELSRQIVQLYDYMERIKEEIATVKHPARRSITSTRWPIN